MKKENKFMPIAINSGPDIISQIGYWAGFATNIVVAIGAIGGGLAVLYQFLTGGLKGFKFLKKFNGFIDRIDCFMDDYFPEVLAAMEKKGLISTGASARWISQQAKILKNASPIHITKRGEDILNDIGFPIIFDANVERIKSEVLKLLPSASMGKYELETACLRYTQELFDENDPIMDTAKEYLFGHPNMPPAEMKSLIGIYLRDRLTEPQ